MGNTITVGRAECVDDIRSYAHGFGFMGGSEILTTLNNYPLESFLDYLETPTHIDGSHCLLIVDPVAFIKECETKMPKLYDEMDDLDSYCTSMVIDNLPFVLLMLKGSLNSDTTLGRQSHYFINITRP